MLKALYIEKDPYCAAWLRSLIDAGLICRGDVDARDIRDVPAGDLAGYTQVHLFAGVGLWSHALRMAGWGDDRPVWTCSCPCQPFSQAGRGAGIFDDRHLWPAAHWLIAQHHPGAVVGEQVASPDGIAWFDIVSADLEALDYACRPVDFPSAGVGAPNIRQRLWWVADTESRGRGIDRHGAVAHRCGQDAGQSALGDEDAGGVGNASRIGRDRSVGCCGEPWSGFGPENDGRLGNPGNARLPDAESPDLCGAGRRTEGRATEQSGGALHPWREPEWIDCRDGRRRPTQPGIFPLAPRRPGDVAKLRAYGNAINPWVAAQIIRAWMDEQSTSTPLETTT